MQILFLALWIWKYEFLTSLHDFTFNNPFYEVLEAGFSWHSGLIQTSGFVQVSPVKLV